MVLNYVPNAGEMDIVDIVMAADIAQIVVVQVKLRTTMETTIITGNLTMENLVVEDLIIMKNVNTVQVRKIAEMTFILITTNITAMAVVSVIAAVEKVMKAMDCHVIIVTSLEKFLYGDRSITHMVMENVPNVVALENAVIAMAQDIDKYKTKDYEVYKKMGHDAPDDNIY